MIGRGSVVRIPFGKGNRLRYGIVTETVLGVPERDLKVIESVLPPEVSLDEEMMALCDYLREQIFCTFGEAARAILPSPVYKKSAKRCRCLSVRSGLNPDEALADFRGKNKEKYSQLLTYLALMGTVEESVCCELMQLDAAAIRFLEQKGWIEVSLTDQQRAELPPIPKMDAKKAVLSPAQQEAFETLRELSDRSEASAALLHGITGSGKTQVILELCDHVLAKGQTVLFLVPEIALTGQSAALLCQRYRERVAIVHSALSEGERRDAYIAIAKGEKNVVLGTRSAVFAPLQNLGLLVIDEEQDQSYKSDTQLKFHARDVARFRCAYHRAMLLLASATPDIETYHKAKEGKYALVTMKQRFGSATLPEVRIVDLRPDLRRNPTALIGSALRDQIQKNLEAGEQTILLMNRRGYRRFVSCTKCGEVIRCPNCSVSLTLHNASTKRLSCHYCGWAIPMPNACPSCHEESLLAHGYGIQQLEEEIHTLFPTARCLRMDSDSMTAKHSHEKLLVAFRNKEADILIGTQMVAKGHNFPNVTLVGIVMADSALYLSDYRAGEHCFSLLTQVIGRAGRAEKKGRAIIQTLNPRHEVFSLASAQNYEAFYEGEIALRRSFRFPPFCSLAVFTLAGEDEALVFRAAKALSDSLAKALAGEFQAVKVIVYGPFDAPIYRVKNVYRKRFILKYKNNAETRALFHHILRENENANGLVKLTLDINPALI